MFTVKYHDNKEDGIGSEQLFGDVASVVRTFDEPKNLNFDLQKGLTIRFKDGSVAYFGTGRFWVMNERGSTVASYVL